MAPGLPALGGERAAEPLKKGCSRDVWVYNLWWPGVRKGNLGSVVLQRRFLFGVEF
jgi:hypothetical protein